MTLILLELEKRLATLKNSLKEQQISCRSDQRYNTLLKAIARRKAKLAVSSKKSTSVKILPLKIPQNKKIPKIITLESLQFQLEIVKKDLKNKKIRCKGNLVYHKIQNAISRRKIALLLEEQVFQLSEKEKVFSKYNVSSHIKILKKKKLAVLKNNIVVPLKERLTFQEIVFGHIFSELMIMFGVK